MIPCKWNLWYSKSRKSFNLSYWVTWRCRFKKLFVYIFLFLSIIFSFYYL